LDTCQLPPVPTSPPPARSSPLPYTTLFRSGPLSPHGRGPFVHLCQKRRRLFSIPDGRFSHFYHFLLLYFFLVYGFCRTLTNPPERRFFPMHTAARVRRILPALLLVWTLLFSRCPAPPPPALQTAAASRCWTSTGPRSFPSATRRRASAACTPCATPAPSWTVRSTR